MLSNFCNNLSSFRKVHEKLVNCETSKSDNIGHSPLKISSVAAVLLSNILFLSLFFYEFLVHARLSRMASLTCMYRFIPFVSAHKSAATKGFVAAVERGWMRVVDSELVLGGERFSLKSIWLSQSFTKKS